MANEYVTRAEVYASRSLTGTTFAEADVDRAIASASRAVDELCGRRFWLDADANQVRYYTPATPQLALIDDIVTVTSVKVDRDMDGTFEETWVENTDFFLHPLNGPTETPAKPRWRLERHPFADQAQLPPWPRCLQVTGKFGWPAVPDQIKEATGILAGRLLMRAREAPFAVVGLGVDGVAVRIAREDPDVLKQAGPFVRQRPIMGML